MKSLKIFGYDLKKKKGEKMTQTLCLTYRYLTFQLMKIFDFFILLRFHHIFLMLRKQKESKDQLFVQLSLVVFL